VAQQAVLVGFAQYGVGHSGGGSHQHDFLAVYGAAAADDLVADVVDGSAIRRLYETYVWTSPDTGGIIIYLHHLWLNNTESSACRGTAAT
jgi:hypothetical protein